MRSVISNDHDSLPKVLPGMDVDDRLPAVLEPAHDVLLVLDLALRDARDEVGVELVDVLVAQAVHEEALDAYFAHDDVEKALDWVRGADF